MKSKIIVVLAFLVVAGTGCVADEPADNVAADDFAALDIPGGVRKIVIARDDITLDAAAVAMKGRGAALGHRLDIVHGYAVTLPNHAAAKLLASDPAILRVEDDPIAYATGKTPPPQTTPWGITDVGAPGSWATSTGLGAKVAVLDTGISTSHPDLKVKGGANFVRTARSYNDDNGHGSHCAGTIAALNNTQGVVGVAPAASLYAVKVLDKTGSGTYSQIIAGINWAVSNGMDVISMSLGGQSDSQALHDACDAAAAAGVLLVAAAGNDGDSYPLTDDVDYPGRYDSVMAVAAIDSAHAKASWSSDGAAVEIAAPGVNIYSTLKGTAYGYKSGTSMATPHVAGVAALLISAHPACAAPVIRETLTSTAIDLGATGRDYFYGFGLVSAPDALRAAAASCL